MNTTSAIKYPAEIESNKNHTTAERGQASDVDNGPKVTSEEVWKRLSPGSLFCQSQVGRHLSTENLFVQLDGRGFYACVAYLTTDCGGCTDAHVHRHLFSRAPSWKPSQIRQWEEPIRLDAFFPGGLLRALPIVMHETREFVQREARNGWKIDRWLNLTTGQDFDVAA